VRQLGADVVLVDQRIEQGCGATVPLVSTSICKAGHHPPAYDHAGQRRALQQRFAPRDHQPVYLKRGDARGNVVLVQRDLIGPRSNAASSRCGRLSPVKRQV
jgi:hypothetical protein